VDRRVGGEVEAEHSWLRFTARVTPAASRSCAAHWMTRGIRRALPSSPRGGRVEQVLEHLLREKGSVQATILAPGALASEVGRARRRAVSGSSQPITGSKATVPNPPRSSELKRSGLRLGPSGMGAASLETRAFHGR
jgi:hypothetical protein